MRIYLLYYIGLSLFLSNCKDTGVSEVVEETQEQIQARTISERDIDDLRYSDFGLSADSKKAVKDWQKFQELINQTEFLKNGDLSFFNGERLLLNTFLQEMSVEMPKPLQTNEIMARIVALDTKMQKLNSLLTLGNIDKEEQLQAIKEYLITLSNLILQINKKFEFEKNNVLKPQ
ncbi:hypothetical protein [Formosa sp. Hel1_31_208]|uniref:hypothetical protein n=1 Tax=Formosa sp. Hel1_31_208 TaxID=1798225 RepID=UPI0012FE7316|nr:hypothetical protein [Formosa sp. Hel1_31_208]